MTPSYLEIAGLKISEPATFATDWVMGGLAAGFALNLLRSGRHWWAAAFGALSLSSFLGGTWHGLRLELPPEPAALLWQCTLATALLCACLLVIAAAQLLDAASRRVFIGFALVKLVILLLLTWPSPDFLKVLLDFGISFTIVAGIAIRCGRLAPGFGRRLAAGIILFALGGAIQAFGLSPHPWFNHNDLFHLIQILANTFLFLAARRTPTIQPAAFGP